MLVSIKGTLYNVKKVDKIEDADNSVCGVCRKIDKKIEFVKDVNGLETAETIIHELVHAFLYECGAVEESSDESLVSWIARQFIPIYQAFNKVADLVFKTDEKEHILLGV